MLLTICQVIMDFVIVGIPMFLLGMFVNEILNEKNKREIEDNNRKVRNNRINYIGYLTNLVIKKRQNETKIDVD